MSDWATIVVAIVGAGGPASVLLTRLGRSNSEQHQRALAIHQKTLTEITATRRDLWAVEGRLSDDIKRVEDRLDRHIDRPAA